MLIAIVVVAVSLIRIILQASRNAAMNQGRRTKIVDSTVRDVKSFEYREKRLKILEQMQSGQITLDEAQRQLDDLDRQ
jgi:hypothetical protein